MEITLKDQSVIDIGKTVGDNVNSLTGGASTALVPAGGGAVAPAGGIATPMNPFDSMMVVLSDIRDGIYSLVDKLLCVLLVSKMGKFGGSVIMWSIVFSGIFFKTSREFP